MLLFSNSFIVIDILCSKLPCTVEGCEYRTLQKKNLETHILRQCVLFLFSLTESLMHSIVVSYSEKKYKCKDDLLNCTFKSCDPAALLRHRKTFHGYIPRRRRKPVPAPGPQPPAVPSRHRKTPRRVPVVVPAPLPPADCVSSSSSIHSPNSDSFPFGEMTSESSLGLQVPPMSSESSPHFPLPPGSLPPCQWPQWDDVGFWAQRNAPASYDWQGFQVGPANPTTSHGSGHQLEHWQLPTYSYLPLDTWSPFFNYSADWHQTPSQSQSQFQYGW